MKKSLMIIAFLFTALVAKAQFEKGTWLLNPSVTGLDLSYSSAEKHSLISGSGWNIGR